jgi:hypothetical protein
VSVSKQAQINRSIGGLVSQIASKPNKFAVSYLIQGWMEKKITHQM